MWCVALIDFRRRDYRPLGECNMSKPKELTKFQEAILWAVETEPNQMACTWTIAQKAFPERWAKRSGRGALIGHIDRAAMKMADLVHRLPPKDRHGTAIICKIRWS